MASRVVSLSIKMHLMPQTSLHKLKLFAILIKLLLRCLSLQGLCTFKIRKLSQKITHMIDEFFADRIFFKVKLMHSVRKNDTPARFCLFANFV